MRRVLVVAYYFPPMGLSGVQRVAKFVKYLPAAGWQPTVLTAHPGGYFAFDASLEREVEEADIDVVRTRSLDPTRLFGASRKVALPDEATRSLLATLSSWLFVPDNKLGWLPFAVAEGLRVLRTGRFDAILSSAPPYSGHLAAAMLARLAGVPLVTDFRDDWVGNPRHVYPTAAHRALHAWLERWTLRHSSAAVTINASLRNRFLRRNHAVIEPRRFHIVEQGYDPDDFADLPAKEPTATMTWVHSGIFYDVQTPDHVLHAMQAFLRRYPEARAQIRLEFVGLVPERSKALAERLGLAGIVRYEGYLDHADVPERLARADVLWMTIGSQPGAESISSGKLYEYVGSGRPIVALVPEGVAAATVRAYDAGWIAPPEDVDAIEGVIEAAYTAWRDGQLPTADADVVRRYDRRSLARKLGEVLDDVVR